jgi:hypothetical protein
VLPDLHGIVLGAKDDGDPMIVDTTLGTIKKCAYLPTSSALTASRWRMPATWHFST